MVCWSQNLVKKTTTLLEKTRVSTIIIGAKWGLNVNKVFSDFQTKALEKQKGF